MHATGLSMAQIHALMYVYHAGESRVAEIGALNEASPAAASQLVERLVRQGLVERSEDPQNRRIKKVRLSERGRRLIREGMSGSHSLREVMQALPAKQRETVQAALGYLAQAGAQIQAAHSRLHGKDKEHASHA
jgi:DNA-binding MarR family transcriptional regulator